MSRLDDFTRNLLSDYFGIGPDAHPDLMEAMQSVELQGGEWLFRQGDPGDALYFVIRGRLEAWHEGEEDQPAQLLGEMSCGEPVGEIGLLTNAPRSASVRAMRDSLLTRIDRATLEELAHRVPEVILRVTASVAERLQRKTEIQRRRPKPRTLAIVQLDPDPDLAAYADRLTDALTANELGVALHPKHFDKLDAPVEGDDETLSPAVRHWIGTLEDDHERIVFRVEAGDGEWADYAARQADIVIRLGVGGGEPGLRDHERDPGAESQPTRDHRDLLMLWHRPGVDRIEGTRRWLEARPHSRPLHVRADVPADHERVVRILTGRAVGLVLSGGAVRGLSHIGTYKAMCELGIPVDWIGGTSMGACMAAVISRGWDIDTAITKVREAFVKGRPLTDYTLPIISLVSGRRLRRLTRQYFDVDIEDLPIPYYSVSCALNTGSINIHESGQLWHAVCASVSLPGLFPPTVHQRQLTVDGAVLNNLPIDVMQNQMVSRIIAVDLGMRRERLVDYKDVPGALTLLRNKLWPFGKRVRVPGLASLILKSIELGSMARVSELAKQADLLLRPPVHRFNMLDVKQFDDLVATAYEHARPELSAWLERQEEMAVMDGPAKG